ncbi:hypothetical protein MK805_16240 [Shimazuella sp. AN120528]|uniref:hypothetical protein n=1 Tax=Shimazuella soli TaxID=1892854 RepID=UPI001F0E053A|nr:hypothetical protein [Shimazuella soli]MCH5586490.1 hypothetical protein [Shimazuella soli]
MYLANLLGLSCNLQGELTALDEHNLTKVRDKVLGAGVKAIRGLNLTFDQLQEIHNKQKAFTIAWLAMFRTVCTLSHRPAWEPLPSPKDAYEKSLNLSN